MPEQMSDRAAEWVKEYRHKLALGIYTMRDIRLLLTLRKNIRDSPTVKAVGSLAEEMDEQILALSAVLPASPFDLGALKQGDWVIYANRKRGLCGQRVKQVCPGYPMQVDTFVQGCHHDIFYRFTNAYTDFIARYPRPCAALEHC